MSAPIDVTLHGTVARALPTPPQTDDNDQNIRLDRYGEVITVSRSVKMHGLADEGSYFVATNPTPGTGIATTATVTTLSDTLPYIVMQNTSAQAQSGKRIYLDYIRLLVAAAGTAGASIRWAVKIDSSQRAAASGGTAVTAVNVNMDSDNRQSVAGINIGAVTAAAVSPSVRLLGSGLFRPVIPVVGDKYVINFGGTENMLCSLLVSGTAIANVVDNTGPVIIGPGQQFLFYLWLPSQSGASSYEVEIGYFER